MQFQYDDGGRKESGYKGSAGDCVARSIAIASGRPYKEIYDRLADIQGSLRKSNNRPQGGKRSARNGINVRSKGFKAYMAELGFVWHPTMQIGSGCKVHLTDGELPPRGRFVVAVSKHYTALVDGIIHDTHDPQRTTFWYGENGEVTRSERCVYGYWQFGGLTSL